MTEPLLQGMGAVLLALASLHLIFPQYFDWKRDLAPLQTINREMMIIHTFFIALVVALMGLLAVTSAHALVHTELGRRVCGGIAFFWFVRLLVQWLGYSASLWRGKLFETSVHIIFTGLWTLLTLGFGAAALGMTDV